MVDALPEGVDVADVVEPDVGQPRDRLARLLDDPRHVPLRVGHHDPETLVVVHFLGPDDPVGVGPVDQGEVRLEHRIHEDDQHRTRHVRPGEIDRAGGPVLHLLLDVHARHPVASGRVFLDLALEVSGDDQQLGDVDGSERVHHPVHDRTARDLEHRLRHEMGVRPEPRALARQGDDDLHAHALP